MSVLHFYLISFLTFFIQLRNSKLFYLIFVLSSSGLDVNQVSKCIWVQRCEDILRRHKTYKTSTLPSKNIRFSRENEITHELKNKKEKEEVHDLVDYSFNVNQTQVLKFYNFKNLIVIESAHIKD